MAVPKQTLGPIRTHKFKIEVEYEGEPLDQSALDQIAIHIGDDMGIALRMRHKDADGIYVLGAAHFTDWEEGGPPDELASSGQ